MSRRPLAVLFIIAVNIAVFVLWKLPDRELFQFMLDHFLVSWNGLRDGRVWTLLTSAFSHNMLFHFFLNMYVLKSFGSVVEIFLGAKRFLVFFVIASIASSLSHSLVSAFFMHDPRIPALGASGAISGLVLLFSFMFPKEKILLLGFIPLPALWGAIALVGLDVWGLYSQIRGGGLPIGHGAHLGGALTGLLYFWFYLRNKIKKEYYI